MGWDLLTLTGQSFHSRFFRALSYKLWNISNRGVMQQHLRLLNSLEDDSRTPNALLFVCIACIISLIISCALS